MDNMLILQ